MIFWVLGLPLVGVGMAFALPRNALRNIVLLCVSLTHLLIVAGFWISPPPGILSGFLALDSPGLIILSILSVLFFAVSLYVPGYVSNEKGCYNRVFTACVLLLLF